MLDLIVDPTHPFTSLRADCPSCLAGGAGFACLSHTCPDCGCQTDATYNAAGELLHTCCDACTPVE